MKYYVIADPHGFYTEMCRALEDAGFFEESEEKKLIVCGDLLDRGEEPNEMVDFMLELDKKGELIYIHGNHESLFETMLDDIDAGKTELLADGSSYHCRNGTFFTAIDLLEWIDDYATKHIEELAEGVRKHRYYTELLPKAINYYETKNHVFVHGWLPAIPGDYIAGYPEDIDYTLIKDWRNASLREWRQAEWYNGMQLAVTKNVRLEDKTVVCGHFRTSYGHSVIDGICTQWEADAVFTPYYSDGLIALDACTKRSGFVNCIVIDDEPI